MNNKKEDKPTMSQTFLRTCLTFLAGIIALWIALELLARFWMWLLLIAGIGAAGYIVFRIIRARQDRW